MRRALNDAKPSSCWGMGAHDPCTQSRSKADCSCTTPLGRQVSDDLNTPGQVSRLDQLAYAAGGAVWSRLAAHCSSQQNSSPRAQQTPPAAQQTHAAPHHDLVPARGKQERCLNDKARPCSRTAVHLPNKQ